jgi:hypothetical protein
VRAIIDYALNHLLLRLNPDFRAVMNYFVYSMMNGLQASPHGGRQRGRAGDRNILQCS